MEGGYIDRQVNHIRFRRTRVCTVRRIFIGGYMKKNMIIAAGILVFICISGVIAFVMLKSAEIHDPVAEIYVDGKLTQTVVLSGDDEFIIETESGYNRITIANGSISVSEADCPDKTCVNTGAVSTGVVPIICLPHRLEIRVVSGESENIDAAVG